MAHSPILGLAGHINGGRQTFLGFVPPLVHIASLTLKIKLNNRKAIFGTEYFITNESYQSTNKHYDNSVFNI